MTSQVLLSASQISDWLLCPRKWAYKSHLKLNTLERDSPAAGKRVHSILEKYLVSGTPIPRHEVYGKIFNVGACAFALARDLPPAGSCKKEDVESHFVYHFEGIDLQGYRDLKSRGFVRDHKTTGSLRWAKTEEELGKDVQAIIYAQSMFAGDEADDSVTCEWGYGQIKGPAKTKRVLRAFSEQEAGDLMESIVVPPAREILTAKKLPKTEKDVAELAPNLHSCDKMGGCDFRSVCPRGTRSLGLGGRKLAMALTKDEALALLRAKREARMGAQIVSTTGTVAVDVGEVVATTTTNMAERIDTVPEIMGEEDCLEKAASAQSADLTSPDVVGVPKKLDKVKKTRGVNPKKAQPEVLTYEQEKLAFDSEPKAGFTLYVGCSPTKSQVTYLHEILPDLTKAVEEASQLAHWSLVEFGAGKGHLATAMKKYLAANQIKGAFVVKFPSSDESRAVLQVLIDNAAEVVL